MSKVINIAGKDYTEDEVWAIRRYIERMKAYEEAEEIVHHIMEDEADNDPAFAEWLDNSAEDMTERIADRIEQRNSMSRVEVCYDPYAEVMRQYYELALAEAKN